MKKHLRILEYLSEKKNCQNILSPATREDKYIGRHHIIFKWQKKNSVTKLIYSMCATFDS